MSDDFIRDFGTALDRAAAQLASGHAPSRKRPASIFVVAACAAVAIVGVIAVMAGSASNPEREAVAGPQPGSQRDLRPAPAPVFGGVGSQFPDCPAKVYEPILELRDLADYERSPGYPVSGCPTVEDLRSQPGFMAEFNRMKDENNGAQAGPGKRSDFPVNDDGQTYGSTDGVGRKDYPDLILVEASNGRQGYVENDVLNEVTGANVSSPAEAVAWQRKMDAAGQASKWIPVYLSDGKTQIGTFEVDRGTGLSVSAEDSG